VVAGAQPMLCAALNSLFPHRSILVIVDGVKRQELFFQDLQTWQSRKDSPPGRQLFFPSWEILPQETKLPHVDVISERLETLLELANSPEPALVLATGVSLMQRTFSPEELRRRTRRVSRGDSIDPLDLAEWLEEQGYDSEAQVTGKGEIL
jgi:transcription-repair coupling factor (superfamily II helicase)